MSEQPFCKKQNDLSHAQTEALRLADALENTPNWQREEWNSDWKASVMQFSREPFEAAAELRRLHEEVQEQCRINGMGAERELRLMAEKRELLEALKEIEWSNNEQWRTDRARAAIAKAEGETK